MPYTRSCSWHLAKPATREGSGGQVQDAGRGVPEVHHGRKPDRQKPDSGRGPGGNRARFQTSLRWSRVVIPGLPEGGPGPESGVKDSSGPGLAVQNRHFCSNRAKRPLCHLLVILAILAKVAILGFPGVPGLPLPYYPVLVYPGYPAQSCTTAAQRGSSHRRSGLPEPQSWPPARSRTR